MTRPLALALLVVVLGCEEARTPAPLEPPTPAPEPTASPPAPAAPIPVLEGLDGLEDETATDEAPPVVAVGPVPERGCAVSEPPVRVLADAGRPAIARGADAYYVASYVRAGSGEAVAIARVGDERPPTLFSTLPVERGVGADARRAAPAITVTGDGRILCAATDASGALLLAELPESSAAAGTFRVVAEDAHADGRFSPVVAVTSGATVLAWTDGSGTPMRVRILRLDRTGRSLGEHDVTPEAGGAAAPSFGRGEGEPTLYVVDPRVAISVVSRTILAEDGVPGPIEVVRPLARAADPASFVVVRVGGVAHVAYTAVGSSGSRAVGLLRAGGSEAAAPIVSGLGFGEPISVVGDRFGTGAVFAAEAPSAADPAAPHEVRVRILGADGMLSEPLVVPGATEPAIAAGSDGQALLATNGGFVTRLRCR